MHQEQFLIADFELLTGIASEKDAIPGFHLQRLALAVVAELSVADTDDRAPRWLVLSRVRQKDSALGALFRFLALDDDTVAQRLQTNFSGGFRFRFCSSSTHASLSPKSKV